MAVELGYSAQERANQLRCLARILSAVRLCDSDAARRHMERLVKGSSEYLAKRSPELVAPQVKWGEVASVGHTGLDGEGNGTEPSILQNARDRTSNRPCRAGRRICTRPGGRSGDGRQYGRTGTG